MKERITTAHRTCDLILGFGDGKSNQVMWCQCVIAARTDGAQFNGVQYSASVANFMNDSTQMPLESWHPRMESVCAHTVLCGVLMHVQIVYFGMDWLCPGYDSAMHTQLSAYYGNLTLANTKQYITGIVQTGVVGWDVVCRVVSHSACRQPAHCDLRPDEHDPVDIECAP